MWQNVLVHLSLDVLNSVILAASAFVRSWSGLLFRACWRLVTRGIALRIGLRGQRPVACSLHCALLGDGQRIPWTFKSSTTHSCTQWGKCGTLFLNPLAMGAKAIRWCAASPGVEGESVPRGVREEPLAYGASWWNAVAHECIAKGVEFSLGNAEWGAACTVLFVGKATYGEQQSVL